jgi:hypothetical protein
MKRPFRFLMKRIKATTKFVTLLRGKEYSLIPDVVNTSALKDHPTALVSDMQKIIGAGE